MKKLYCLLLWILMQNVAQAATEPRYYAGRWPLRSRRLTAKEAELLTARSLQLTCYLTDVLRLNTQQAGAVRRATLLELQQQRTTSGARALATYDVALLRVLTSGQYSTFRWLLDRQPVASLLINPATVKATELHPQFWQNAAPNLPRR